MARNWQVSRHCPERDLIDQILDGMTPAHVLQDKDKDQGQCDGRDDIQHRWEIEQDFLVHYNAAIPAFGNLTQSVL